MLEYITVTFGIPIAYLGLGIAALTAVLFPVMQMFQDLKKAKTTFIGVGALIVLFVVCYLLAEKKDFTVAELHVVAAQMKFFEAGIYLTYMLLFGTVAAILYSTVSRYFK